MELDTIVCGDCLDVMAKMEAESVDLIILDPPFDAQAWASTHYHDYQFAAGVNWGSWARHWIEESYRLLKANGTIFAVGNYRGFHYLAYELARAGFKHHADYQVAYKGSRKRPSFSKFHVVTETWFYGTKDGDGLFRASDVTPLTGNQTHYSYWLDPDGTVKRWEKSEDLMGYFIDLTTERQQLIFDPFMGSGTTAIAALKLGRHFYGCDINPEYVKLANERIAKARLEMAQMEIFK